MILPYSMRPVVIFPRYSNVCVPHPLNRHSLSLQYFNTFTCYLSSTHHSVPQIIDIRFVPLSNERKNQRFHPCLRVKIIIARYGWLHPSNFRNISKARGLKKGSYLVRIRSALEACIVHEVKLTNHQFSR